MGMLEQTSWNSNGSTDCGGMCWNLLEFHHLLESIALPEFRCAGLCWIPSMEVLEHAGTALRWNSQAGIQHDQFSDVVHVIAHRIHVARCVWQRAAA